MVLKLSSIKNLRKCIKNMTSIVIYYDIVLLLNRIKVKIDEYTFCSGPPSFIWWTYLLYYIYRFKACYNDHVSLFFSGITGFLIIIIIITISYQVMIGLNLCCEITQKSYLSTSKDKCVEVFVKVKVVYQKYISGKKKCSLAL